MGEGFVIFMIAMYFLPTIIALIRKKKNTPAIALLNTLMGWSIVGWFVALIWSVTKD